MQKIFLVLGFVFTLFSCQISGQSEDIKNIEVTEFKQLMTGDNTVILDVRTPKETAESKIEGAMEINYFDKDFQQQIQQLDKDKTYLVYCRSGNRSGKSAVIMEKNGFSKVYNLEGGYKAWSKALE
jgi:rhodanese-related sulfurtransferase